MFRPSQLFTSRISCQNKCAAKPCGIHCIIAFGVRMKGGRPPAREYFIQAAYKMQTLLAILCVRTHAWSVHVACSNALRAPLMLSALGIQRDVVSCFQFWNFSELYYSHFAALSCCVLRVIYHDRLHAVARFARRDGVAIAGCVFAGFTDNAFFF